VETGFEAARQLDGEKVDRCCRLCRWLGKPSVSELELAVEEQ
jgi:hypothetical protein